MERPLEDDDTDDEADDSLQPGLSEYRGVDDVEGLRADDDAGDQQERDARDLDPSATSLAATRGDIYQHDGVSETVTLDHIKKHYYRSHVNGYQPTGLAAGAGIDGHADRTQPRRAHYCEADGDGPTVVFINDVGYGASLEAGTTTPSPAPTRR